jgi:hypothetical protein
MAELSTDLCPNGYRRCVQAGNKLWCGELFYSKVTFGLFRGRRSIAIKPATSS